MAAEFTESLQRDTAVVGNWVTLPEPAIAELFASLGFEFVTVDMEHSAMSLETMVDAVRAIDAADAGAHSVVRLPGHDADVIKRVLDAGVDGIMAPMVDTVADATAIVEACRYPPAGERGVGPGRGSQYGVGVSDAVATDDDGFAVVAQIESPTAIENAGEIAAVAGIDALFVGQTDLSVAMGGIEDRGEGFADAVDSVLASGAAAEVPVGTFTVGESAIERWAARGFDFIAVGFDAYHLVQDSQRARDAYDAVAND